MQDQLKKTWHVIISGKVNIFFQISVNDVHQFISHAKEFIKNGEFEDLIEIVECFTPYVNNIYSNLLQS